jgi:hypothetical protein
MNTSLEQNPIERRIRNFSIPKKEIEEIRNEALKTMRDPDAAVRDHVEKISKANALAQKEKTEEKLNSLRKAYEASNN